MSYSYHCYSELLNRSIVLRLYLGCESNVPFGPGYDSKSEIPLRQPNIGKAIKLIQPEYLKNKLQYTKIYKASNAL